MTFFAIKISRFFLFDCKMTVTATTFLIGRFAVNELKNDQSEI